MLQNIPMEDETMSGVEEGLKCFNSNFNCCQAVLKVFSKEYGMDEEMALKVATGFGGGMRRGEVCGAVTGGIMVIGLRDGHSTEDDLETKKRAYALTADFEKEFEKLNGSIICKELLGFDLSKEEELKMIKEQGLFDKVCPKLIKDAILILER